MDICKGKITRERKTVKGTEKFILDFFIVCDQMLPYIQRMRVDEERKHSLTRYGGGNELVKESDHNLLILDINMKIENETVQKVEVYNLKNLSRLNSFKEDLDQSDELSTITDSHNKNLKKVGKAWFHLLKRKIGLHFKKIRVSKKKVKTKIYDLMKKKQELKGIRHKETNKDATEKEIDIIEKELNVEVAKENRDKIKQNFKLLAKTDGSVNINGMWKVK